MRFSEILGEVLEGRVPTTPLKPVSTGRFDKEAAAIGLAVPDFENNLRKFINFKIESGGGQYGKRDTFYTGGVLKGYRHCHIVGGNIVLIYDISDGQLRLLAVGNHDEYEGGSARAAKLGKALSNLAPNSFSPVLDVPAEVIITPRALEAIHDSVYEVAGTEPQLIVDALSGKDTIALEFVADAADMTIESIYVYFDQTGKSFDDYLKKALKDNGHSLR